MKQRLSPEVIGMRVAKEFFDGAYVNLGGGMPSYAFQSVATLLGERDIVLHSENGVLGFGRPLTVDEEKDWDVDLINATSNYVARLPGMCFFDHAQAFDMIRGHHLDFTVLGAYQVSEKGDIANWITPEWLTPQGDIRIGSVGGAMDLVVGAKRVLVMMEHTTKKSEFRILKECTYPVTGRECASLIFTDLAVMEVTKQGLLLREIAPGWKVEEVQALTEPRFIVAKELKEIEL